MRRQEWSLCVTHGDTHGWNNSTDTVSHLHVSDMYTDQVARSVTIWTEQLDSLGV